MHSQQKSGNITVEYLTSRGEAVPVKQETFSCDGEWQLDDQVLA